MQLTITEWTVLTENKIQHLKGNEPNLHIETGVPTWLQILEDKFPKEFEPLPLCVDTTIVLSPVTIRYELLLWNKETKQKLQKSKTKQNKIEAGLSILSVNFHCS